MTTKTSQGEETVLLAAVNALGQLNWGKLAYRKRMHGSRTVSTAERERGRTRWGSWLAWAVAALCLAQAQAAGTEKVLHNFGVQSSGAAPQAGLIRDSAGNFYGTASSLGPFGYGVVFKVDSAGQQTVLYNFTGGADGANPNAGPIRDAAGDFYSTTAAGGTSGKGVVYKLDTTGHETVLYNFTGGADGGGPLGVVFDPAGNLYGITGYGGEYDDGVVYKLDAAGNETVLHSFAGGADGEEPLAPAIRDAAGNLYGSTAKGGINQAGTIFKIDAAGVESVLYAFTGGKDGRSPQSPVILDSAGNLYGTTNRGGVANAGVVFKLSGAGQLTTLYSFPNSAQGHPAAGLVFDSAGNLYGTTEGLYPTYAGMVYKLNPAGQETTLYAFTGGADGAEAMSALVLDPEGNLYGTTYAGGPAKLGTVYEVSSTGQETVLYAFLGALDGALPSAGVIADPEGNLYGTTAYGGTFNAGTVFKVDPSGHQTILYNFAGGTDAAYPSAPVTRDADGNLYGTTTNGGAANYGTVYKLDTTGHETVLYSFTGGTDGGAPYASVVLDPAGNLYGTAVIGGAHDAGVVFKVDPAGQETVLYAFTGFGDGYQPYGGVIRDSAGNLYGTAGGNGGIGSPLGVVYKLDPSGQQTVLYGFQGGTDGADPRAGLFRDAEGNLYGTTYSGGLPHNRNCSTDGCGVVYKVDPAGNETVLYRFQGESDGGAPMTGVIRDSAGNLYGTTATYGADNFGVLYKVDPTGNETVLHFFTGGADGGNPNAVLFRSPAGALSSTTEGGGAAYSGVLFRLTP
ncbi:MAG: choice-of-anchor tandem repeat GloVer-containing protein [Bryobacteraceae bacterium]